MRPLPQAVHRHGRHGLRALQVPLHKWLLAIYLLCSSKKGIAAHQLHRMLGVTYKTAWFMEHRIREAMRDGTLRAGRRRARWSRRTRRTSATRTWSTSDEARRGRQASAPSWPGRAWRQGRIIHVDEVEQRERRQMFAATSTRESALMTDESRHYLKVGEEFASHRRSTTPPEEYVRDDVHTNTIEGYFSRVQARHEGHLPALRREAPAPLPERVRFPLQQPRRLGY